MLQYNYKPEAKPHKLEYCESGKGYKVVTAPEDDNPYFKIGYKFVVLDIYNLEGKLILIGDHILHSNKLSQYVKDYMTVIRDYSIKDVVLFVDNNEYVS